MNFYFLFSLYKTRVYIRNDGMNKFGLCFLIVLSLCSVSFASQVISSKTYVDGSLASQTHKNKNAKHRYSGTSLIPLCTDGNLICALGNYTFTSNNYNKPIYANIGIMCTSDGGICTNGQHILRTNRTIYQ